MPIRVCCPQCGANYNLADSLAGKKIRCKKCQGIVPVPTASVTDEEEEPQPERPARREKAPASAPRSNTARWVVLTTVAVVLCLAVGLALWFFVFGRKAEQPAEELILGSWQVDLDATKVQLKGPTAHDVSLMWKRVPKNLALEFHKDGTGRMVFFGDEPVNFTWKVVVKEGNHLTLAVHKENEGQAVDMRVQTERKDRLAIGYLGLIGVELKRGPAVPAPRQDVDEKLAILKPRARFSMGLAGLTKNKGEVKITSLFLSDDGGRLAVANFGGDGSQSKTRKAQVWDTTGEPKKLYESDGALRALSPNGKRLVRSLEGTELLDVDSRQVLAKLGGTEQMYFRSPDVIVALTAVGFEPKGGGATGLRIEQYDASAKKASSFTAIAGGRISRRPGMQCAVPLQGGRWLAVLVEDANRVKVWDLESQQLSREIRWWVSSAANPHFPRGFEGSTCTKPQEKRTWQRY
jgi:hypothetical protein